MLKLSSKVWQLPAIHLQIIQKTEGRHKIINITRYITVLTKHLQG